MTNIHYYFFIGTDAELIKLLPVLKEFETRKITYKIISSGQNNIEQSKLFAFLKKKSPDIVLYRGAIRQTAFGLFAWFVKTFLKSIITLRSEFNVKKKVHLIIHGDTVSTMMGAFIGKICGLKIAHVEAGLRSFNYLHPFPEEIDRVIASHFVSTHFAPNEWALENLKKRKGEKINTHNNTLLDSLHMVIDQKGTFPLLDKIKKEKYFIFIMHRQENLFNHDLVEMLLSEILQNAKKMKCVFVMHKPTQLVLEKNNWLNKLKANKNIILSDRLHYGDFMKLLNKCEYIITDGGSNQEESYYLGKPALILRSATERIEGLNENVVLSKNNIKIIRDFLLDPYVYKRKKITAKVKPSKIIVDYLVKTK